MLLFNRTLVTTGDMEAVFPIVQELAATMKMETGVSVNVWAGSNGYVAGTLGFSVAYESLAARAEVTSKLGASKAWWISNRKLREHMVSMEPDIIYQYIRGGTLGTNIPLGTVVSQCQFQLAQGGDWMAALKWANEYADMCKKLTGIDTNILHTLYGVLGGIGMLTGIPSMAAVDGYRGKLSASSEFLPKFLEGVRHALAGSVIQRHLVKIA